MIEIKHGIIYYRTTPIYAPFMPDSDRVVRFECLTPKCGAGTHTCFNEGDDSVHANSFELRPHEPMPRNSGDPIDKSCPDCGNKTLVKA